MVKTLLTLIGSLIVVVLVVPEVFPMVFKTKAKRVYHLIERNWPYTDSQYDYKELLQLLRDKEDLTIEQANACLNNYYRGEGWFLEQDWLK